MDESEVPNDWKYANMSPISKKRSRSSAKNYRPVSLTSLICKIFETIIRDTLVKQLENNLLIKDSQHGLWKGRSCLTNHLSFLDIVTGYVDSGSAAAEKHEYAIAAYLAL